MFKNYLKITLRNLYRQKLYALINIFGLTLGLGCCLILSLYIVSEINYDTHFRNYDRIYRLVNDYTFDGQSNRAAMSSPALGQLLLTDYPDDVEAYTRFQRPGGSQNGTVFRHDQDTFYWDDVYLADINVFEMFDHQILYGNPEGALDDGLSVAISETFAETYFGNENPIGEVVSTDTADYAVNLVFADLPENTHMKYDVLISMNRVGTLPESEAQLQRMLGNIGVYTFTLMREGFEASQYETMLDNFVEYRVMGMARQFGLEDNFSARFWAQRMDEMHLDSGYEFNQPTGNAFYIYSFAAVAIFILVIACINYINLATARSMQRSREVGMRKVLGAQRSQLIGQFLGESIFFALIAMVISVVITNALIENRLLGELFGGQIYAANILDPILLLWLLGLSLVVGVLSGLYPAFYLSSVPPVTALSGDSQVKGTTSGRLREVLVFAQFTISIGIIASTLLMSNQMSYVSGLGLGFEKENKILVPLRGADVIESLPVLKNELQTSPNIIAASSTQNLPGSQMGLLGLNLENNNGQMELQSVNVMAVSEDFLATIGVGLLEGRDFSQKFLTDIGTSVLVNQTLVDRMGWDQPIGKRIQSAAGPGLDGRVIGIVEDFNYASLYQEVGPLMMVAPQDDFTDSTQEARALTNRMMVVNVTGENLAETLEFIRSAVQRFDSAHPFEFEFLDDRLNLQYESEQNVLGLIAIFSSICIFVSCLGLFGLASFTTERRTKEIGIRKVLGATESQIIGLLAQKIVILVLIGAVVASVVSFMVINEWLNTFAYRDSISPIVFIVSALMAVVVAITTVALQSWRTVRANPITALRYE